MNPAEDINGDGVIDKADEIAYQKICDDAQKLVTDTIGEIRTNYNASDTLVRVVQVERFVPVSPQKVCCCRFLLFTVTSLSHCRRTSLAL